MTRGTGIVKVARETPGDLVDPWAKDFVPHPITPTPDAPAEPPAAIEEPPAPELTNPTLIVALTKGTVEVKISGTIIADLTAEFFKVEESMITARARRAADEFMKSDGNAIEFAAVCTSRARLAGRARKARTKAARHDEQAAKLARSGGDPLPDTEAAQQQRADAERLENIVKALDLDIEARRPRIVGAQVTAVGQEMTRLIAEARAESDEIVRQAVALVTDDLARIAVVSSLVHSYRGGEHLQQFITVPGTTESTADAADDE